MRRAKGPKAEHDTRADPLVSAICGMIAPGSGKPLFAEKRR